MVCTIFTTTYTAPLGHNESVQKKKILNLSDILDDKITHLTLLIHQLSWICKYISYYVQCLFLMNIDILYSKAIICLKVQVLKYLNHNVRYLVAVDTIVLLG